MRLYLVRHPQTVVPADICYGSSDVEAALQEQMHMVAALTAASTPPHAGLDSREAVPKIMLPRGLAMYSSPLRRCAEVAKRLAERLECTSLSFDARLAEMHFGRWELQAWDDIPRSEVDAWAQDLTGYQPGGGESVLQMAERVCAFYQELLQTGSDSIVVCHAGTIRMFLACGQDRSVTELALQAAKNPRKISYGELIVLQC
ncbi:MAG TPA: histidine phosphatase family protein [Eoetvoesiella sp.]